MVKLKGHWFPHFYHQLDGISVASGEINPFGLV